MKLDEIKVNVEYEKLVPPLSDNAFKSLEDSFEKFGFREAYPVVINMNNEILDGHHRYRISKKLNLTEIPVQIENFDTSLDEKEWVILTNVARRHLNTAQRSELLLAILDIEKEKAKRRQISKLKQFKFTVSSPGPLTVKEEEETGKAVGIASKKVGISEKTGYRVQKIKKVAIEHKEIEKAWQNAIKGKETVTQVYREAIRFEHREERKKERIINIANTNPILKCGDFRELIKQIPDNSIDLVMTDPPYSKEYLELWEALAKESCRTLKPSGFFITYSGQTYFPEIFDSLRRHLNYYWLGAINSALSNQMFHRNVFCRAKPILFFQKAPFKKNEKWTMDSLKSPAPDKDFHEWGQSTPAIKYLIEKFTEESDTVLDPMLGGGSVLESCVELKRKIIGFEKDKDTFDLLMTRLEKENENKH